MGPNFWATLCHPSALSFHFFAVQTAHLLTYLLISEPHLPSGVSGDVHPAEEHSLLVGRGGVGLAERAAAAVPEQLCLDAGVVLLVDDVVHAVAVN